jgi:hypothetical protein
MADVIPVAPPLDRVDPRPARARRLAFYVVLTAALLLLAAPMAPFLVIPVAWPFMAEELGAHRFHDIGVATMLWLMIVGLFMQLRNARQQIAAMQQVLLVIVTMLVLTALSRPATLATPDPLLLFFGLAIAVAALHPCRADSARLRLRADPFVAGVALLAAGPVFAYARGQLRLDHSALPLAAHGGHWTAMAILTVALLLLSLLGATRPTGWRVPVWSAGATALLFGIASAALPHMPSSVGPFWGVLAAAWGISYVVTAEVRFRKTRPGGQ